MSRSVLFAAGGTAGHVFPAIAVARALQRLDPDLEPLFVGSPNRLEATLVPEAGFRFLETHPVSVPRRLSPRLLTVPFATRRAVRRCMQYAREHQVVGVVAFGGFVAYPAARAAWRLQLPLVVHEQNAVPGLSNRMAARWADRIAVSIPSTVLTFRRAERCAVTGNPVREEILHLDREATRAEARERFGLRPDRTTLLVFGGSQGARSINRAILAANHLWGDAELQILHATGRANFESTATLWARTRERHRGPHASVVDFIDSMSDAYAAADVVVCRAGATSLAELSALGIPSVMIPYPHATADHQMENARALERAGGTVVIEDRALDGRSLVGAVKPLIDSPAALERMSLAAHAFGRRDAAESVARLVYSSLDPSRGSS
ncbi:MAG: undecaprenyldiphospho-muramoylpentapeptide beta-N-acetylglucosaminyltransferase [Nitriliruptoraceae bacterium]